MRPHPYTWWQRWGQTIVWGAMALSSAFTAYQALDRQLDDIALRLQRIEIVLQIDPLTKGLMRTAQGNQP